MYRLLIILLMVVLPIAGVVFDLVRTAGTIDLWSSIGNWFVFWAVGVRLFTAGVSQIFRPQFTSQSILGTRNSGADQIVQELGFANVAMGAVGLVATLWLPDWIVPAALAGAIFLGLAGFRHVAKKNKNPMEALDTYTDIFGCVVLAAFLTVTLVTSLQA